MWVEVYSGGTWHHFGAAEPSELDETWFDARLAPADGPRVFASTYARARREQPGGGAVRAVEDDAPQPHFPLPWRDAAADRAAGGAVPAVDVTARYRSESS